ncbi:MAG: GspMb/PilO family protein [Thermoanaerobaculia bacterium]
MAIWRERRWWILAIGILLTLNTIFFFTYRVRYEQRVDEAHARLDQSKKQLAVATARRTDYQSQLDAHKKLLATISTVYDDWWSTPEKRLTAVIVEVRSLVEKSGLALQALNFSQNETNDGSGTTTVDISFTVRGNYMQLRQVVNLLELSDQFVIIDAISFAGDQQDGTIGLNLRLRTLFKGEKKVVRAKAAL